MQAIIITVYQYFKLHRTVTDLIHKHTTAMVKKLVAAGVKRMVI